MKILFVIKTLSMPGGGAERVLADVASALARRDHAVSVLSYDTQSTTDFYRFDASISRIRFGKSGRRGHTRVTGMPTQLVLSRRVVQRMQPDVVIAFMHSAYIPQGLALIGTGIPLVASEHIVFAHYKTVPFEKLLLRFTPLLVTAITVVSEFAKQSFPRSLRQLMTVIPNPVSLERSALADVSDGPHKTLLTVGRLTRQKDHHTLISAFGSLASAFPDWSLKIVGEGPLFGELSTQIDELGLGARVTLMGATDAVTREYSAAQLFVMPSRYESFGLATAEALAHGLPVVGFADCPGTNELVQHEANGLLVQGSDRVVSLAEGLARLMRSPRERKRMARAAAASVERFSLEDVADQWEALLTRVKRRQ